MRQWLILAAALAVAVAHAEAATQVVHPTGVFPADVLNVRAAVNAGGTVLLKATDVSGAPLAFNFGPATTAGGRLIVQTDVEILGETVGGAMTTIRGGNAPVTGFGPVRLVVRGIHFDGPRAAGVLLLITSGAEITGNRVTNVRGFPLFPGVRKGQGIWVTPFLALEDIAGTILIADNVVEHVDAESGFGLALAGSAADMTVARNTIRGVNTAGILAVGNSRPVLVEDNDIAPGPGLFPDATAGNGITADGAFESLGLPPGAPQYIRRNKIVCDNPFADGILVFEVTGSVVTKNDVTMHDSFFGGITLFDVTSATVVSDNRVSGSGGFALDIFFVGLNEPVNDGNTFTGNNIARFEASIADVFLDFDTTNTVLVGRSGTVIDLGVGNRVTGFTKGGHGGPGPQIKEALAAKHALLREILGAGAAAAFAE